MLPVEQNDRPPFISLKTPVFPACLCFDLRFQIVISLQMTAARCTDLHKCELPLIARILFKKTFQRQKPFQNSFRVVEAVYPDSQEQSFDVQALQQSRTSVENLFATPFWRHLTPIHADRKRVHRRSVPQALNREMFPVNS